MSEISIEDVKSYIQGKERHAVMTVKDINDPDYKSMRNFVLDINPHAEDYMHSVTVGMNQIMSSLRHMEKADYERIVNTFKKYEIKGTSSGISGNRTYGYDRSRVDGRMIRRRRQN
jgi:hypothetical protein|tara:strand:+ start:172 stop:519 length:348 start_codon:yes stop_codon:yes gene_type:complete